MRRYDKKNVSRIALAAAVVMILSGCAGNVPFTGKEQGNRKEMNLTAETLGLEADFSYERKREKPHVQVDCLGFLPKSTKTAVFQGEELPETFQVMDKDSGECVYEGDIRLREKAEDGIVTGYGSFTEVEKEGTYYIKCDKIGCSYYFDIGRDIYLETAEELGAAIEKARNAGGQEETRETADICETVGYLLVNYEMYPELIWQVWESETAGNEEGGAGGDKFFRMLRRETDRLLSLQDERTGGIYKAAGAVSAENGGGGGQQEVSEEATAAFAGTMAKYSYLYQQYDLDYANICLKAAAKAWRYLDGAQGIPVQGQEEEGRGAFTGRFYAASELYRASNEISYHNYMLQNQEFMMNQKEDFYLLMAKATYLSTKRSVDHALCGQMMDSLIKEAGRIAEVSKDRLFLVKDEDTDVILWDMTVMSLANYAIMNYEYVSVIENHVHYLMGRNKEAEFLPGNPTGAEAAKMLLLLSVVEAESRIIEESEAGLEEGG